MSRYGAQYGPDLTFLGVGRCDLDDAATLAGADVVVVGAPFDGGTSARPGARFGPQAIRQACYLAHDGSRPSLALRVDGLRDLRVVDAGDVEMFSGDVETSLAALESAVERVARAGAVPVVLGGDHSVAYPDAKGVANVLGHGRVSMVHFDAHADTGDVEFGSLWGHGQPMRRLIESGALRGDRFLQIGLRGYWPGPETLSWMAGRRMRSYEMTEIGHRGLDACLGEAFHTATDDCDGVFLSVDIDVCDPGHAPGTGTPGARRAHRPRAAGRRAALLLRAARGRGRRRRGVPAVRPRRRHRLPRQPGRPRGAERDRPPPPGRRRRTALGPGPAAARRPVTGDPAAAYLTAFARLLDARGRQAEESPPEGEVEMTNVPSKGAVHAASIVREHDALANVAAEVTGGSAFQRVQHDEMVLRDGRRQLVQVDNDRDWTSILAGLEEQPAAVDSAPWVAETLGPWDTGYIAFSGGVPVGGYSQLTLHRDGSYNFSGHFHVSGAPSYNTGLVYAVRSGNGTVYTFVHHGRVHGTFEAGSRDDDWGDSGVNPALAAGWADLSNSWSWHWSAAVNIDIGALVGGAVQAVGWAASIIAIVA